MRFILTLLLLSTFSTPCLAGQADSYSPSDYLQVEHVTTIDSEQDPEQSSEDDVETSSESGSGGSDENGDAPVSDGGSEPSEPGSVPGYDPSSENDNATEIEPYAGEDTSVEPVDLSEQAEQSEQAEPVSPGPGIPVYYHESTPPKEEPPRAPEVSRSRSAQEEKSLKEVVHSLEFGSLENSIRLLEAMVRNYPYDPDYRSLLDTARNLNRADIWYRYQRRLHLPSPSTRPKEIKKLIKMPRKEKPINALKQTTWFLLIKNNHPAAKKN